MADATASARAQLRKLHRAPEPEVLAPLLKDAALDAESRARVETRALAILGDLRGAQSSGWVNQFLQEYRLNTQEGIALLSLADDGRVGVKAVDENGVVRFLPVMVLGNAEPGTVWVGMHTDRMAHQRRIRAPGDRDMVGRWSEQAALDLARRHLEGLPIPDADRVVH